MMLEKIFSFTEWWKNVAEFIFFIIFLLFSWFIFSLVSTSIIASDKLNTNSYYFFFKHLIFIFLILSIIISFSFIDQKTLINLSVILFVITFITLALIPFIGIEVKGSARWLDLPFFPRFQPIELIKPFFIIIISLILSLKNKIIYI